MLLALTEFLGEAVVHSTSQYFTVVRNRFQWFWVYLIKPVYVALPLDLPHSQISVKGSRPQLLVWGYDVDALLDPIEVMRWWHIRGSAVQNHGVCHEAG